MPDHNGPTPDYSDSRWLTANGERIVPGLRVWDNDLRSGSVDLAKTFRHYNPDRPWDGWFYVLVDETGTHDLADGSRVTTVHPFTHAAPDPQWPRGIDTPAEEQPGKATPMKIVTIPLTRSRYGGHDVWTSADKYTTTTPGQWVELRMQCRYTRHVERLSILYTGPEGASRVEQGGPEVPGPHGTLIAQASVISAHPAAAPTYTDVTEGDVLVLNGQRMVIADNLPMDYPHLVTEAEWGLITAQRAINTKITELQATADPADPTVRALYDLIHTLTEEAERLRARSRTPDTASAEQ